MKIIAEKINGTRKKVFAAVNDRDTAHIQTLAKEQVEAGANWLDVNAGTAPAREPEDLVWLVNTVQEVTDVPLCLDSANPEALKAALKAVKRTPMINSISGEQDRLDNILPLVAEHGCEVIALCLDGAAIPPTAEGRMKVLEPIMAAVEKAGVAQDKVYVDPLVMTVSTDTNAAMVTVETMRQIKATYPDVHMTSGLSNVSFGLPARAQINRAFLTLALAAGMDSAICNPNDKGLIGAMMATEVLLGQDRFCMNYTKAAKKGRFDVPAPAPAAGANPSKIQ